MKKVFPVHTSSSILHAQEYNEKLCPVNISSILLGVLVGAGSLCPNK
jgi:hypothetical protein